MSCKSSVFKTAHVNMLGSTARHQRGRRRETLEDVLVGAIKRQRLKSPSYCTAICQSKSIQPTANTPNRADGSDLLVKDNWMLAVKALLLRCHSCDDCCKHWHKSIMSCTTMEFRIFIKTLFKCSTIETLLKYLFNFLNWPWFVLYIWCLLKWHTELHFANYEWLLGNENF